MYNRTMQYILMIFSWISLYFFMKARIEGNMIRSLFYKVICSSGFLLTGIYLLYIAPSRYSWLMVCGLFFGLLGDIWLGLKWIYEKQQDLFILAGFFCFAIGHFFYIMALWMHSVRDVPLFWWLIPLILAIVSSYAVVTYSRKKGIRYGKFQHIAVAYGSILLLMTLLAGSVSIWTKGQDQRAFFVLVGGLCFLISDLVLSMIYFKKDTNSPKRIIFNHVMYYMAQFFIAFSILR